MTMSTTVEEKLIKLAENAGLKHPVIADNSDGALVIVDTDTGICYHVKLVRF